MFRKGRPYIGSDHLVAVPPVLGRNGPRRCSKSREHDFGTVARGAKAEYRFDFENLYMEDVHVAGRSDELRLHHAYASRIRC